MRERGNERNSRNRLTRNTKNGPPEAEGTLGNGSEGSGAAGNGPRSMFPRVYEWGRETRQEEGNRGRGGE